MTEWRETPFWGYLVSDEGQVRGRRGKILRPGLSGPRRDYELVFCGRGNPQKVHRLVAEAFLGPIPEGMEVAHLNGDSKDNRASNLAYKTHRDNEADKKTHGTLNPGWVPGESNGMSKLTELQVLEIRARIPPHNKSALSREFGVSRPVITGILNRTLWRHI